LAVAPDRDPQRQRDRALLAVLLGCGLRRRELAELTLDLLQRREDHWAIVDLVGKGGHIRTVPVPDWVKQTLDEWMVAAGIVTGRVFRCVCRAGTTWGDGMTERVVWHVVKEYAAKLNLTRLAPHDLRRSCARLCHMAGGEMEQIQFLLGHVSVQTTEKYLGSKQRLRGAVNDQIGIEPWWPKAIRARSTRTGRRLIVNWLYAEGNCFRVADDLDGNFNVIR
jgi:site-specific recombinase XerD